MAVLVVLAIVANTVSRGETASPDVGYVIPLDVLFAIAFIIPY
jgi:hypothetical protein